MRPADGADGGGPAGEGAGAVPGASLVAGERQPRSTSRAGTTPQRTCKTLSSARTVPGKGDAESAWGARVAPHLPSVAGTRSARPVRLAPLRPPSRGGDLIATRLPPASRRPDSSAVLGQRPFAFVSPRCPALW